VLRLTASLGDDCDGGQRQHGAAQLFWGPVGITMSVKSITLKVTGDRTFHCSGCENTIRRALSQLPGVRRAAPSRKTQQIELILDTDQTPVREVQEKLDWMGWEAHEAEEDSA